MFPDTPPPALVSPRTQLVLIFGLLAHLHKSDLINLYLQVSKHLLSLSLSLPPSLPPSPQNGDDPGDDDWSVDTSEAAVKARMENLTDQATSLALTSDLEKKTNERVDIFYKFVEVSHKEVAIEGDHRGYDFE